MALEWSHLKYKLESLPANSDSFETFLLHRNELRRLNVKLDTYRRQLESALRISQRETEKRCPRHDFDLFIILMIENEFAKYAVYNHFNTIDDLNYYLFLQISY